MGNYLKWFAKWFLVLKALLHSEHLKSLMLLWCDLTWASSLEGLEKLLLQYSHLKYLQNISWVFWYKKWFTHNWKSGGFNGIPDLSADAVSPQVIPQWVSVGVGLITDVALGLLALVSRLVNTGSWTVVETSGTPITKIPAKQTETIDQNILGSFYQSVSNPLERSTWMVSWA